MIDTKWVQVGELGDGFAKDPNLLKPSEDLIGKTHVVSFEDGSKATYNFKTVDELVFEYISKGGESSKNTVTYLATSMRPGIYYIDFVNSNSVGTTTLVINLETNNAIYVNLVLPSEEEVDISTFARVKKDIPLTSIQPTYLYGKVDQAYEEIDLKTSDLVGRRVQYTYSEHEVYEHIYLNDNYYTWQCLKGVEKGLTDTDFCHFFKLADNLYVFSWQEKIIPTLGLIIIDFDKLKTTGKIVGYEGDNFDAVRNFPVGAYAKILNQTEHELP